MGKKLGVVSLVFGLLLELPVVYTLSNPLQVLTPFGVLLTFVGWLLMFYGGYSIIKEDKGERDSE